jgi:RNA polymerase sigma factor (sigma-70 family)
VIQDLAYATARRYRLPEAEAEDFVADVQLRIITDEYAVLRKFRRQCALRTYLTIVIKRMGLDWQVAKWGKWRPSARSRREGTMAVMLEQLTSRDGLTFDEACRKVQAAHGNSADHDTLAALFSGIRRTPRPRFVTDEQIVNEPAAGESADQDLLADEGRLTLGRAVSVLAVVLRDIDPLDRLLLKLRFRDQLTVATIAWLLEADHKQLHRRFTHLLRRLRRTLERAGVSAADLLPAVGRSDGRCPHLYGWHNVDAPR